MRSQTLDGWKQELSSFLKKEIDRRLIDHLLVSDIAIIKNPGSIIKDQGAETTNLPDGGILFSSRADTREIIESYKFHMQFNAPFRIWYEDKENYKPHLKRLITNISNELNKYAIKKLSEEAKQFKITNENITFENILSALTDLSYYPDVMLLNTIKCWELIHDGSITQKKDDQDFIGYYGQLNIRDSRLLSKNEALLMRKEDLMMQKNEMSFEYYPDKNPKELHIHETRVIWPYNNRGLGYLS